MLKIKKKNSIYCALIENIFFNHWESGVQQFEFTRSEIEEAAKKLDIDTPKNLGDVTYSFRYRASLPEKIIETQPIGKEWIIEGAGQSRYRFKLCKNTRIIPNDQLQPVIIPGTIPEIVRAFAQNDEQALLAIIRYNRLIDIFLGLTTFSLQNHLRTTVKGIGQIEIDEVYLGLDRYGRQHVIPIQAKIGSDQIGVVQPAQDIAFARQRFPNMHCRSVSAQFMKNDIIALLELGLNDDQVIVIDEQHYKLAPAEYFQREN